MNLSEIIEQTQVNFPRLLGIINFGDELEEPGPHFVIVLKVLEEDYINLCNVKNIEPLLTFIPTEYYPNLWFRLQITFGNKDQGTPLSYFFCEYNFCILSKVHKDILDELSQADNFTLLFTNSDLTKTSYWHFQVTTETKTNIKTEIEACKNGISLYKNLDDNKCIQGQHEIEASRKVSGEIINKELVLKQSSKRLSVKPFPKDANVVFISKKKS